MRLSGIAEVCDALASPMPSPAGGSTAAAVGAMAASLVVMVAHGSPGWDGGATVEGEASGLRDRLLALAEEDAAAVAAVLSPASAAGGDAGLRQAALIRASMVPLEIAESCSDVVLLATRAAAEGKRPMRGDAEAAAHLARAAMQVGAAIVELNVGSPGVPARRGHALVRPSPSGCGPRTGLGVRTHTDGAAGPRRPTGLASRRAGAQSCAGAGSRMTQRKPMWLVVLSIGSPWRAAGR